MHACSRSAATVNDIDPHVRCTRTALPLVLPENPKYCPCTCQATRSPKKTGHYHRVRHITAIAPNATNVGLVLTIPDRHPNYETTAQHLTFSQHCETDASVTGERLHDLA